MPGAHGGGPEHSQRDGKAALWGDPTGLSLMQGNTPPKNPAPLPQLHAAASAQRHEPPWLVPVPLSGESKSSLDVGVLHRMVPGPGKAWPAIGIPGTAASPTQQHRRLPGTMGNICCSPSRCCIPLPSPVSEFASKVPFFRCHLRRKMSSKGTSPQRHLPPRQAVILMPAT